MAFQKVEYELPDGDEDQEQDIEINPSSALELGRKTANSDIEIEIVDDTPPADRNRKASEPPADVTDEELEDYSEKVRKRIQHFSKGYHDERRAKEQALRERQELEAYAKKLSEDNLNLQNTVGKNQTALLEQAKRVLTADLEKAKKAYKEAYEAGDSDGVLAAQEELTNTRLKTERLNNIRIPSLQETPKPVTMASENTNTPAMADPKAAQWAADNTWFGTDDEMTSYALGLHSKLVKQGVDPQSEDYYEAINARMRKLFPESFDGESGEAQPAARRSQVVGTATRSTAPKKVRLTRTQVALAKRMGIPIEVYAKQVADDMRKQKNG
jgi:hypothetical protein